MTIPKDVNFHSVVYIDPNFEKKTVVTSFQKDFVGAKFRGRVQNIKKNSLPISILHTKLA